MLERRLELELELMMLVLASATDYTKQKPEVIFGRSEAGSGLGGCSCVS